MSDSLLEIISTLGGMSLENFDNAFVAINPHILNSELDSRALRRQVIYSLDALGHCEFDFEKRQVYVCQPRIALLPGTSAIRAVLTGARSKELIEKLLGLQTEYEGYLSIFTYKQTLDEVQLPSTIIIQAADIEIIEQLIEKINISLPYKIPTAWVIANFSNSILEYEASIEYIPRSPLNWNCRTYNTQVLHFEKGDSERLVPRLVEYTHPFTQQKLHRLINRDTMAEVDREWGRYIALNNSKVRVILYDECNNILALPITVQLPRLLTRAITLCSGFIPSRIICKNQLSNSIKPGTQLLVYTCVTNTIADIITSKISQNYISYTFKKNDKGDLIC